MFYVPHIQHGGGKDVTVADLHPVSAPCRLGTHWEDRGSRAKCAGEETGGVDVYKEMFILLQCLWVPLAAENLWYSKKHNWFWGLRWEHVQREKTFSQDMLLVDEQIKNLAAFVSV